VHAECDFPDDYVPRLRLLGEMMTNALHRKRAFNDLRTSEERLERAAVAANCGLWEIDIPSGRIWVAAETRRLYGLTAVESPNWNRFVNLVHPQERDAVTARVAAVMRGGGIFDQEYRVVRDDGSVRWMHARGRADGPARLLGVSVDVTDRIEAERREKEQAARMAEALDEVKRLRDRLEQENLYLRRETQRGRGAGPIVDRSPAIRGALALADNVAPTNSTVLLVGETGTGKERLATYIHEASPRRGHTMVRVNCSAIPSALIESELFGREKGAYTGALSRQIGRFELAHGSTLFLDEVGDLPLDVQVKLLRVLQERSIERLGSPKPIAVDVRIIAATNRSLEQSVRDGTFRADLYYRLNVFPIVVPPLRERREDIPALIGQLVDELGAAIAKPFDSVSKASVDALKRYDWPGNVRELRNVIERAMILASGPVLTVDLPASAGPSPSGPPEEPAGDLQDVERQHILRVLAQTGWRIRGKQAAADVLGLKPTTLEARMKRLGIRRPKTSGDS
jgi:PAS domain S-box-containing protein